MKPHSTSDGVALPYRIQYAHQTRPEGQEKPFDLKWACVTWKHFPADEIDPFETWQVIFQGKPISESKATPQEAVADACYWLMDQSRAEFNRGMVGPLNDYQSAKAKIVLF